MHRSSPSRRPRSGLLVSFVVACALASTGCYKNASFSVAEAPADAMAYGGAPGDYDYSDDVMLEAEESSVASRGRSASGARYDKQTEFFKDEAPPPAPAPEGKPVVQPEPIQTSGGEGQAQEPTQTERPSAEARKVVYTATLNVAVWNVEQTLAFAETLAERYGGWIQARYDAQITLRVPAERLSAAIAELSERGRVLGKSLQADDVTAEYVDLESRLVVLEQMEKQLLALLAQAKTVEESLKVRKELDRVRMELELARARMRVLGELISFSTLTLYLTPESPVGPTPSSNDPFPWVDGLGVEATEFIG